MILISNGICHAEQKYMPFFGTVTERHFRKKIQTTEIYTNDATLFRNYFFPQITLGDGSVMAQRFGFFSGFTDKG